jgi:hypothetical protein
LRIGDQGTSGGIDCELVAPVVVDRFHEVRQDGIRAPQRLRHARIDGRRMVALFRFGDRLLDGYLRPGNIPSIGIQLIVVQPTRQVIHFDFGDVVTGRCDVHIRDRAVLCESGLERRRARPIAGYSALDLNASVSNEHYTVRLYAKNVTDKQAYLTYTPIVNQATGNITQIEATTLQPRIIGLAFEARY